MITIKGINKNNELEYELMGGKLQYANQLIITDTTNKKIVYDKTIDTFMTTHKIPNDVLENAKTYKLLLLCLDEDDNFIEESEYYYIPIKSNKLSIEMEELNTDNDLYFAKVEPNAIIPSKRDEDAGYDIYTCEAETIFISPCSTRMIDTGIAIACSSNYFPKFFDKGGMGSKGIIVGAGVGDSGYRDKYFIPLINTNKDFCLVITNQKDEEIKVSNYFDTKINKFTYIEDIQKADDEYMNKCKCNPDEWIGIRFYQKENYIIKPLNKAITQFVMIPVPKMNVKEITSEELKNIKSERGLGKMGSTGK